MIIAWLTIAALFTYAFRNADKTWRVGLKSLAWPTFPVIIGVSKVRHARRRRALS